MEQPLVSVITITRNRGNLLGRCIKSVLSQTYTNIEHIVVDGASDDNTDEVVSSFKDERLRYIKLEENWPIVDTINYGVKSSSGEFITFLDSDDEFLPDKIAKQVALIERLPADYGMVYCWMTYIDAKNGQIVRVHSPKLRGFVGKEVVETPEKSVSGTPTFFFRRSVFLKLGGWRSDIGIVSDWELAARLCQKWKVDYVPESLVNVYINHGEQRMSERGYYKNIAPKQILYANSFLEEFAQVYKEYPSKAYTHYENLFRNHLVLRNWRDAWHYWMLCFRIKPSIKLLALWLYVIIKGR